MFSCIDRIGWFKLSLLMGPYGVAIQMNSL